MMSDGDVIFVLCEDDWGSTFSQPCPTGEAVFSEEEARVWVKQANPGFKREYYRVIVVERPKGL